jgi:hypothetical protein
MSYLQPLCPFLQESLCNPIPGSRRPSTDAFRAADSLPNLLEILVYSAHVGGWLKEAICVRDSC